MEIRRSNRFLMLAQAGLVSAFTFTMVGFSHAAILYWDGTSSTSDPNGGTGAWDTVTSNWDQTASGLLVDNTTWPASGTDNDAVLGGTAGTVTIAAGGVTANDITFNTTGYTIQSNTLTLNGTTPTITTGTGISATISSVIAGTVNLTKSGAGTLILSGPSANTYTGNVTVNGGTLQIGKSTALGVVNSAVTKVTVASGATVDFNGIADATYGYTISGTGVGGNGALVNNGIAIGTGSAQASNIRLAANATIGGTGNWALLPSAFGATNLDLAGFTLTKSGSNTISLASTTTTAGAIQVSGGTLALGVSGGTGVNGAASSLLLDNTSGVSISLGQSASIGSLAGGGTTGGNVALGANTLTVGALGTNTSYAGVISGVNGALTKTGNGTLNLTGVNTFTGALTINGGTVNLPGGTNGNFLPGKPNVIVNNGGTLAFGGFNTFGNTLANMSAVTVNSGGTILSSNTVTVFNNLTLNSGTVSINGADNFGAVWGSLGFGGTTTVTGTSFINVVSGAGTISVGNGFSPTFTVSTTGVSDSLTISAPIAFTTALVKQGLGTLTLSGPNSYNGGTTISAGTVQVSNATGLGTAAVTIGSSGTLTGNSTITVANAIANNGNITITGAGINFTFGGALTGTGILNVNTTGSGKVNISGTGTQLAGGTINITNGATVFDNTVHTVAANINVVGAGNSENRGAIRFGVASIYSGNISLQGSTTLGWDAVANITGGISTGVAGTSTLTLGAANNSGGDFNISGNITNGTGTLALTKLLGGTVALSGSNSYSGATAINAGTLQITPTGSVTSSTISVSSGGTLQVDSTGKTLSALTLAGGSSLTLAAVSAQTTNISGALTLTSTPAFTVAPTFTTTPVAGTYDLITAGSVSGSAGVITTAGQLVNSRLSGSTAISGNMLQLTVSGTTQSKTWNLTANGTWDTTATSWTGGSDTLFKNWDSVTFNSTVTPGVITLSGTVYAGSTTVANTSGTYTFQTGVLAGPGTLAMNGAGGTLTINTANTFSGGTTITAGTVNAGNDSAFGTGSLTLAGGTVVIGGRTLANSLIATASTTSTINSGSNSVIQGTLSGSGSLNMAVLTGPPSSIFLTGDMSGYSGAITTNNTFGNVIATNLDGTASSNTGSTAAAFTVNNGGSSFYLGINTGSFNMGSLAGTGQVAPLGTSAVTSTLSVGALNSNTTFSGVLRNGTPGILALTKVGSGTLTLSGANTYTGATTINAGTLVFSTPNFYNYDGGNININGASTLSFVQTGGAARYDVNNKTITFDATGGGALTLGTGLNWVSSGNTFVTSGGARNTISGAGSFNLNFGTATFNVANGSDPTTDLLVSTGLTNNSGTVTKSGAGRMVWTGANTYTGATTISGGSLTIDGAGTLGSGGTYAGAISIATGSTFEYSSTVAQTLSGVISGLGSLIKSDSSTLTLTNATNSYSGLTTVSGGILQITANNALGTTAAGTSVTAGAALRLAGVNYSTAEALSINGTGVGGGGALVNSGTSTFAGQVTAATNATINAGGGTLNFTGGLVKNGTVLTLTGGGIINIGTVGISGASAGSDLIVDGVTVNENVANTYVGPTFIRSTASAGTGILNANIAGALPTGTRSAVTMDDSGLGSSRLNLVTGNQVAASLTGAASSLVNLNANTLSIGTTGGSTTFAGVITGTNGNLTKDGASTQVLSGANTYTGATNVTGGVLAVSGSLANTSTTVATGATLKGSGSIGGSVTIQGGGTLAAGNGIESITTGSLSLQALSTFAFEIDKDAVASAAGDLTAVTGNLTFDLGSAAILTLTELGGGSWTNGEKLTLISYTGAWNGGLFNYGGTLADDSTFNFSGTDWTFNYNDTTGGSNFASDQIGATGFVTMTVVPEPDGAALIGGFGLLTLLRRRR